MDAAIGVIIGVVMGLTGAGGALVAIPLFMEFQGLALKEATVLSLLAVVAASLTNFFQQRRHADVALAWALVLSSAAGSYLTSPLKRHLPELVMALLLAAVSLYSLYAVWSRPAPPREVGSGGPAWWITALLGLGLGTLTTLTGLGGGVLMLPVLVKVYRRPAVEAVATGLLVVGLSSLASLLIQAAAGAGVAWESGMAWTLGGILAASLAVKAAVTSLPLEAMALARKIVFSVVVGAALVKIF